LVKRKKLELKGADDETEKILFTDFVGKFDQTGELKREKKLFTKAKKRF